MEYQTKTKKISNSIQKLNKVNLSLFSFTDFQSSKRGGTRAFINYNGKKKFCCRLPKLKSPFGISEYKDKYSLSLSLENLNDNELSVLYGLENRVLDFAEKNSVKLFKKQLDKETIKEHYYYEMLKVAEKEDKNGNLKTYPPLMKIKIPFEYNSDGIETDNFNIKVFNAEDSSHKLIKVSKDNYKSVIPPGCECEVIIEATGIWNVSKLSIGFRISQVNVHYDEQFFMPDNGFIEDDEDETYNEAESENKTESMEITKDYINTDTNPNQKSWSDIVEEDNLNKKDTDETELDEEEEEIIKIPTKKSRSLKKKN